MKWTDIFSKKNELLKTEANAHIDAHTDPHILIAQTIQNLQEQQDRLAAACAKVNANNKLTEMRLARALAEQTKLNANIQAAVTNGHTGTARTFAIQLATVEAHVNDLKTMHEQTAAAAASAQQALTDGADELQARVAEAQQLGMQADQAAMAHQVAENMKAVTDHANVAHPSFDAIRDRVEGDYALAQSQVEAGQSAPEIAEAHAHHEAIQDQADAILARYTRPAVPASTV